MLLAARYARDKKIPYFGICLGMQIAVIYFARDVAGIKDANSGEFDFTCAHKVIDFMPGQSDEIDKGGTLRLGSYPCVIKPGTTMEKCYGKTEIRERHRHRYEFPFYVGVQYHPEFKSRPNKAHPLFKGFVEASLKNKGVNHLN